MDPKRQEKYEVSSVNSATPRVEFYDPSKESVWTRLGVNFESFKRAPGTTGYVFFPFVSYVILKTYVENVQSGQIVAGESNIDDVEKLRADAPMLQQKMKPRHLTMIAVGASPQDLFHHRVLHHHS